MAQLPCIGLWWPLTNPPFGSWAIYFHYGVNGCEPEKKIIISQVIQAAVTKLLSPFSLEVTYITFEKGHVNSPSQKGHDLNHMVNSQ